jgi:hypothetical protein
MTGVVSLKDAVVEPDGAATEMVSVPVVGLVVLVALITRGFGL